MQQTRTKVIVINGAPRSGKEIPEGKIFEFCEYYEMRELTANTFRELGNIFGSWFGK